MAFDGDGVELGCGVALGTGVAVIGMRVGDGCGLGVAVTTITGLPTAGSEQAREVRARNSRILSGRIGRLNEIYTKADYDGRGASLSTEIH
jgi:hypothetical protein